MIENLKIAALVSKIVARTTVEMVRYTTIATWIASEQIVIHEVKALPQFPTQGPKVFWNAYCDASVDAAWLSLDVLNTSLGNMGVTDEEYNVLTLAGIDMIKASAEWSEMLKIA